jgi:carboxymethylenebutenolidase
MMIEFPTEYGPQHGYLALPASGAGAGVLVLHAWWGLTPVFTGVCDRLAAAGFVALAPDLYGGAIARTIDEAQGLLAQRDSAAMRARAFGALDALVAHPATRGRNIGAVGFSMGGAWSLLLAAARPATLAAVVVFYDDGEIEEGTKAAVVGHFAGADEFLPEPAFETLAARWRATGRDVAIYRYPGARHWFFEEDRPEYDAEAAVMAWERTIAFLGDRLAR